MTGQQLRGPHASTSDDLVWLVKSVDKHLRKEANRRMAALELTDSQWPLVHALADANGATVAVHSSVRTKSASNLTRTVDRLEAKGIVRRMRSSDDRRAVKLELTDKGQRLALELPAIMNEIGERALSGFTPMEVKQLMGHLQNVHASLKLPDGASQALCVATTTVGNSPDLGVS